MRVALPLVVLLGCNADSDPDPAGDPERCPASDFALVTDIDETLTTSDAEWIAQMLDGTHVPAMRPDADALLNAYADLGYRIVYITARGDDTTLSDGRSAFEATADWLQDHGFPYDPDDLYLADGVGAIGSGAVAYKHEILVGLQDDGLTLDWAYGNAFSDIEAFQLAGIPDDRIFFVGKHAGERDVQPLPDEEAFTAHLDTHLPQVPSRCP